MGHTCVKNYSDIHIMYITVDVYACMCSYITNYIVMFLYNFILTRF